MGKRKDWIGRRYGRLTVIGESEEPNCVTCLCDCGNQKEVVKGNLTNGNTSSCGCRRVESSRENLRERNLKVRKYGVDPHLLMNMKPTARNKTGVRGVCFIERIGKYRVDIGVGGRNLYCGCYSDFQEAIDVRKEAERVYFRPVVEKYKADMAANT